MLSVSLWALSNIARNPASIITEVCDAICAACCAIDDHIEMDKNTHRRLKSISEANRERTSLLSPDIMSLEEYSERMDAEIDRLKRELESASLLNTNDALESGKEINDARKQLYEVIEKMANEKGRNLPEFRGPGVQEKWPGSIN
jgi:5,10-methenyltetrahydromethanopterin hydrogenase